MKRRETLCPHSAPTVAKCVAKFIVDQKVTATQLFKQTARNVAQRVSASVCVCVRVFARTHAVAFVMWFAPRILLLPGTSCNLVSVLSLNSHLNQSKRSVIRSPRGQLRRECINTANTRLIGDGATQLPRVPVRAHREIFRRIVLNGYLKFCFPVAKAVKVQAERAEARWIVCRLFLWGRSPVKRILRGKVVGEDELWGAGMRLWLVVWKKTEARQIFRNINGRRGEKAWETGRTSKSDLNSSSDWSVTSQPDCWGYVLLPIHVAVWKVRYWATEENVTNLLWGNFQR